MQTKQHAAGFVAMKYQIRVSDPKLFEETPSVKFQLVSPSLAVLAAAMMQCTPHQCNATIAFTKHRSSTGTMLLENGIFYGDAYQFVKR